MSCSLNRVLALMALPLLITSLSRSVYAGDNAEERKTLKGLSGVSVLVDDLDDEIERLGLTKKNVQTDVELRLRKAGIKVCTLEEWKGDLTIGVLHVQIGLFKRDKALEGLYSYELAVELAQSVAILRDPTIKTLAATWSAGIIYGTLGSIHLKELKSTIGDSVDVFSNAFLEQNPKK